MSGYECHIEIENKKPFYVSGDVIEGRLEISVTSPFDVTGKPVRGNILINLTSREVVVKIQYGDVTSSHLEYYSKMVQS